MNRKHGHEIWTFELPVPNGRALDVAIGPDGHAVASGDAGGDFTVVKLDGADGPELWRADLNGATGEDFQPLPPPAAAAPGSQ